jgi:hypothetical protein
MTRLARIPLNQWIKGQQLGKAVSSELRPNGSQGRISVVLRVQRRSQRECGALASAASVVVGVLLTFHHHEDSCSAAGTLTRAREPGPFIRRFRGIRANPVIDADRGTPDNANDGNGKA